MARSREMTEELWFKSRDLRRMFARLGQPTKLVQDPRMRRKYRLFGVAAVTESWKELMVPAVIRQGTEIAERLADGHATETERQAAQEALLHTVRTTDRGDPVHRFSLAANCVMHENAIFAGYDAAEHAYVMAHGRGDPEAVIANSVALANLFRDVFGNPFRPVSFEPSCRTSTAVALAQRMYESHDFSIMPILGDALQDAGCDSAEILDHCRGAGPHVRGCWVVDFVAGSRF